ncbi:MAG: tetratricopeptide repeat protein, partial [Nitrososphaerales archaeon]
AILPFASMSADPNDEFFADGMTEELISTVSNIANLQVISRTSVMHFKKTPKTMAEIAKELNAGSIMEGSVRKAGDKVRVTVQLIDSNKDIHVWAKTYDRQLHDVFAIQSDISMSIADSLKVQLLPNEKERVQKVATRSPEAHLLYMKGRYFWNERTKASLEKAIECFEKAIEKDPGYALAYSGLSDTYSVLSDHGYMPRGKAQPLALKNSERAVELDGSLSEAHASLGLSLGGIPNSRERAGAELRRAMETNPNNAYAHLWYSLVTPDLGEATASAEKATRLDPLNLQIGSTLGALYYCSLRLPEAFSQLRKVIEMGPDFPPAHYWLALAYLENTQPEEAIKEARTYNELSPRKVFVGIILAGAGKKEEARLIADELERAGYYVDPADMAWLYCELESRNKGIEWLKRAVVENSAHLEHFAREPSTREFRKDPEIRALLEKVGFLPAVQ